MENTKEVCKYLEKAISVRIPIPLKGSSLADESRNCDFSKYFFVGNMDDIWSAHSYENKKKNTS